MSRHSIRNAVRLVRGATGAVGRASQRYAGDVERLLLTRARTKLNQAERDLIALQQIAKRKEGGQ